MTAITHNKRVHSRQPANFSQDNNNKTLGSEGKATVLRGHPTTLLVTQTQPGLLPQVAQRT